MATASLNVVYQALASIGFDFEKYDGREYKNINGGLNDSCEYGVLRDLRDTVVTKARLAEVFVVAKERQTYLVVFPHVRELRKRGQLTKSAIQAASNELCICFIQKGSLDTALGAAEHVRDSLKRNFSYFQEDEDVLKLEQFLSRMCEEYSAFQKRAFDGDLLEENAMQLLRYMEKEWKTMLRYSPVEALMEDSTQTDYAKMLCGAANCIQIVRCAV